MARLQEKTATLAEKDPEVETHCNESAELEGEAGSNFDVGLIKKYPFAKSKLNLKVSPYGYFKEENAARAHSLYISPHGIEFSTTRDFDVGALVKINVTIPDYWGRKQEFVEYGRIDKPKHFNVIARVINVEQASKNKKRNIIVEMLNIDGVDAKVLQKYLYEKSKTSFRDDEDFE